MFYSYPEHWCQQGHFYCHPSHSGKSQSAWWQRQRTSRFWSFEPIAPHCWRTISPCPFLCCCYNSNKISLRSKPALNRATLKLRWTDTEERKTVSLDVKTHSSFFFFYHYKKLCFSEKMQLFTWSDTEEIFQHAIVHKCSFLASQRNYVFMVMSKNYMMKHRKYQFWNLVKKIEFRSFMSLFKIWNKV